MLISLHFCRSKYFYIIIYENYMDFHTCFMLPIGMYRGDTNMSGSRRRSIKITGSWKKMLENRCNSSMPMINCNSHILCVVSEGDELVNTTENSCFGWRKMKNRPLIVLNNKCNPPLFVIS